MNNRQEQIEQARRLIATGISEELVEVLRQQFPELKESEDERIRKEIIDWMKGGTTYDFQENKEKWIAYLEKQKEQQPAEWSEDIIRKAIKEVGLTQHQIDWFKTNVFPPKQEWSEEDEFFRQQLIVYCENCVQDTLAAKCVAWLKSLRPKSHWKPSEYMLSLVKKVANGEMLTRMEQMAMETLCNDLQKLL